MLRKDRSTDLLTLLTLLTLRAVHAHKRLPVLHVPLRHSLARRHGVHGRRRQRLRLLRLLGLGSGLRLLLLWLRLRLVQDTARTIGKRRHAGISVRCHRQGKRVGPRNWGHCLLSACH